MTPLEEMLSALDLLRGLRNRTGGNGWKAGCSDPGEGWFYVENADTGEDEMYTERGTNVDLIVTLHRTIDAQLAILQAKLPEAWYRAYVDSDAYVDRSALALARAINGGTP